MNRWNKELQKICVECQECCKWTTFIVAKDDAKKLKEHYKARGFRVKPFDKSQVGIMVPTICPKLKPEGCSIYWRRPEFCKIYDGRQDPFMKDKCKLP